MVTKWIVGELDPKLLFETTDNRDPETSSRFSLPVPNWLDSNGLPLFDHSAISYVEKKQSWRLHFQNYVDGCDQGVKIDGTGVVFFMTPTIYQSKQLFDIIHSCATDISQLTPTDIIHILDTSYQKLGLIDRYNGSTDDIDKKMEPTENVKGYLGSFVYKPVISTAIFISGQGIFDGPALSDQSFDGGGFIVFPKKRIGEVKEIIREYDPLRKAYTGAKVVGRAEFLKTRRDLDGIPFKPFELAPQEKPKPRYHKPHPIAGFPEFSPEIHSVQKEWLRNISRSFDLYGYPEIQTRSIEEMEILLGENDLDEVASSKGIYTIASSFNNASNPAQYGLRFDHTVPMARYIAENYSSIQLPFKSARIGNVWRADKPAQGRFREFIQADIDIVCLDSVPREYDSEIPRVMLEAVDGLGIGPIEMGINNRKILQGFFQSLGLDADMTTRTIRILDKLSQIGSDAVKMKLTDDLGFDNHLTDLCVRFASIKETDGGFYDKVMALGQKSDLMKKGLDELSFVMDDLRDVKSGTIVADLSIARGLQYYTGTVFEGKFKDIQGVPSIIGGGRYDDLASHFMPRSMPGVGISFGITRAIALLEERQKLQTGRRTTSQVLLTYTNDAELESATKCGKELRSRGIACDIMYGAKTLKQQMAYASKKQIPYVLFPANDERHSVEIRDMDQSKQSSVDITQWAPRT